MTLTELRYIVALAQEGKFSRAAERCSVSQPTLSVAIQRLEEDLGVILFERGKGQVSVTDVGEQVVAQAAIALEEADRVRHIAHRGRNQLDGGLKLGVIYTIGPYLLPELIVSLKQIAPDMPLAIEENMTATLADMLRHGEVDAAILALPFALSGVVTRPLYDEPFKVVVPQGHPWQAKAEVGSDEVAAQDVLLLKAGNCFRDQVMDACPQISGADTEVRQGHSIETIRCMVASGFGLSVLPAGALCKPYSTDLLRVVPFKAPAPSRRVALAWRVGFTRPKAVEALCQAVRHIDNPSYLHVH
ncbi:MAG TPA: hydrogen peroxide-inducible genes activator [Azospira sp.]|nr:hydrogen peroxide-inducible genes activator [Azospira sp.]